MLLENIKDLHQILDNQQIKALGLVPTMGALHEGHLSLIENAIKACDKVVVSIFVNPTQFNDPNDLSKYPRTLKKDLEAIKTIDHDILVFVPSVSEIYPKSIKSEKFDFGGLSQHMEGQYRKGHFDGVGTVLKRLFDIVKPQKAYFGNKDYQQLAVVKRLVKLTGQHIEIVGCETFREPNGLAKSSRNKLLSNNEQEQAKIIFESLNLAKSNFRSKSIPEIKKIVNSKFNSSKIFNLEYFEIAVEDDLIPTETITEKNNYRAFIAAYCSGVRLIDNMALN